MKSHIVFFASLVCLPLVSAPIAYADRVGEARFDGTAWTLSSPVYPNVDAAPTLEFSGNRIGAFAGCNRMSGQVEITGKKFKIGPMMSTKMACQDPIMEAERKFVTALQNVKSFELSADRKTLTLQGDPSLIFAVSGDKLPPVFALNRPSGLRFPEGNVRLERSNPAESVSNLWLTREGQEQKIAEKVWKTWDLRDGSLLYAGSDGAGGFENEGQSLWQLDRKTGARRKLMAEVFPIERVREVGQLLVLSMRDGGLGAPHLNIIRRKEGKSVYRQTGAFLSAIRNGRLAIAILPPAKTEGKPARMDYLEIASLER